MEWLLFHGTSTKVFLVWIPNVIGLGGDNNRKVRRASDREALAYRTAFCA